MINVKSDTAWILIKVHVVAFICTNRIFKKIVGIVIYKSLSTIKQGVEKYLILREIIDHRDGWSRMPDDKNFEKVRV